MVKVHSYHLPPTALVPNSPRPLLHYPGVLSSLASSSPSSPSSSEPQISAPAVHDLFTSNAWRTQWIFRYGPTQASHYHSLAHECMVVLSGSATIRFGVADTDTEDAPNPVSNPASRHEPGGISLPARAGDVFILPAGVAHKTFDTRPAAEFALLTPGDGHRIAPATVVKGGDGVREALEKVQLDGFTMIGAYPVDGGEWDSKTGGEDSGRFDAVWAVPKPERDPVLGSASEGLVGLW